MKTIFLAITMLFTLAAKSQTTIKIEELNNHIGDSVKVCTKIYGGIYLDRSKGTPTLLNAGGSYPNNPLTVLLWPEARAKFKDKPEEFFKGKNVCITGKLILYKEKPEIIIGEESQLLVQDAE